MHQPVMLKETLESMRIRPDGIYVDGTMGLGGHAQGILDRLGPAGRLVGMDRDSEAVARLVRRFVGFGERCKVVHGNFANMDGTVKELGLAPVDGVLLDLGVSSEQLEDAQRGFSFMRDGPLDMRMDSSLALTAADLVNSLDEDDLADLLFRLGEERSARRIAARIVSERRQRPILTTGRLAGIVEVAKGGRRGRIHPATQTFQALRMAVNHELENLEQGLTAALALLKPGGRLAAITFHSLEDRQVKRFVNAHVGRWESLQAGGRRWMGEAPAVRRLTRKPVMPAEEEIRSNARSRSARLRGLERLD